MAYPKATCLLYLLVLVGISLFEKSCCETSVAGLFRGKKSVGSNGSPAKETYNMFISEQGAHFKEKVNFDKIKQTVTFFVPKHRNIPESSVMIDFRSNVTVIRQQGKKMCLVRPRSSAEPSMNMLWKSMDLVSRRKLNMKNGSRLMSSEWMLTGPVDLSKLSGNVIEFCRGLPVHGLKKVEQDKYTVTKGNVRMKRRKLPLPTCTDYTKVPPPSLVRCSHQQNVNYVVKCGFSSRNCVYYLTCTGGIEGVKRSGWKICTVKHDYTNAICCNYYCPN